MIYSFKNTCVCHKCNTKLQEYYFKADSKEKFKRCPSCLQIFCIEMDEKHQKLIEKMQIRNQLDCL